jgi:competence protein ComFB
MTIINFYDIDKLRNVNEKRVWELLPDFLNANEGICTCRDCIMDMVAITLNAIPPHYQANAEDLTEAIKKVSDDDILLQLSIAAERVKKHPHH